MVTFSVLPLLAVLVPAFCALLIACTGERRANLREFWSVAYWRGVTARCLECGGVLSYHVESSQTGFGWRCDAGHFEEDPAWWE